MYSFILLSIFFQIILTTNPKDKLSEENLHKYQEYQTSLFQIKLTSCLSLIQYSLKGEGNAQLRKAMKSTKFKRSDFYDKYVIALITQCINNINEGQINYLLIPENLDNYNLKNKTLSNLIQLNYEIKSLELTYEENEINKHINNLVEKSNSKKPKDGLGFLDSKNLIKILAVVGPFIILLIFNGVRNRGDTKKDFELDEGTKELLNAIKERGKNSPNYKETPTKDGNKKEKKEKKE